MEIKDLSNSDFDFSNLENPKIPGRGNEELFGAVGGEKVGALKKAIKEIDELIKGRERLSSQVHEEGERIKKEIDKIILENDRTPMADRRDLLREGNDLKHKKVEISEMQLNEKISCWKDIALLKKERRVYERELTEKEGRLDLLSKILEEEE